MHALIALNLSVELVTYRKKNVDFMVSKEKSLTCIISLNFYVNTNANSYKFGINFTTSMI